jgi:3-hydroxyisobutyrate dehydrogenase-like beta-hydroxyacid dehydrogenase
MTGTTVGFVGIGNMGGAMATRVLEQGGAAVAFDTNPTIREQFAAKGGTIVDSARAVAQNCDLISVVVNTDTQARNAILGSDGVLEGCTPGTVVAVHSTIHLETLREIAASAAEKSVPVVDAAVTGGPAAAARGELVVLLGGDEAPIAAARPHLNWYASLVWHAGPLGSGMAAKIAVMVISFGKLAATYEGLLLANAAGLDPVELAKVVTHSESQSGIGPFFVSARAKAFSADGADLMHQIGTHESPKSQKDLHAALELAAQLGIDLPLARVAHDEMPAVWGLEPDQPRSTLDTTPGQAIR